MTLSRMALIILHLFGDAFLLWLGYCWLGMDESDGSHLAASFGLATTVIVAAAWLHGLALAHFGGLPLRQAAVRSLRSLLPLTLLCLLALGIYAALVWVEVSYARPAFVIASFLTLHLHKPIPPAVFERIFHAVILVLEWGLLPAALMRAGARVTVGGWRAFGETGLRRRSFWVFSAVVAVLLVCALWVPFRLFFWIPDMASFTGQLVSFLLRAGFGYLLFVLSILLLEFITASGKPFETQESTAG